MNDCLFCKITSGQIKSDTVYEDDKIRVFKDIKPKAPIHLLIVPKVHIDSLMDVNAEHQELMGYMLFKTAHLAKISGLQNGFRTVINTGRHGGQEIDHLHLHMLGGEVLPRF
jgi:histidine triad (HIT) family protein